MAVQESVHSLPGWCAEDRTESLQSMFIPQDAEGPPCFLQMQTLPPYWTNEAITDVHAMSLTAVIYAVLSSFLIAWQIWIWYLDHRPAGPQGPPILQVISADAQDCTINSSAGSSALIPHPSVRSAEIAEIELGKSYLASEQVHTFCSFVHPWPAAAPSYDA